MASVENKTLIIAGSIVAVALVASYLIKKASDSLTAAGGVAGVASNAAGAVVDAASGAATGAVVAIGEQFGIPATNLTECEKAMSEGRTWDASFACPMPVFLDYVANGYKPGTYNLPPDTKK